MNKFSPRTDLAIETTEMINKDTDTINGVKMQITNVSDDITITDVEIINNIGAKEMGRPIGKYITLESHAMKENMPEVHTKLIDEMSKALSKLCSIKENSSVLVAGLGNRFVTPDALGPQVISRLLVTRHLKSEFENLTETPLRSVSAIATGVMGITGIETGEILKGITEKIKPDLVIAIDALAARRFSRINTTIQMTNTGVCPGAGVGNKRTEINKDFLGVPVVAIGVPTVVDAATLVNDTMDTLLDVMQNAAKEMSKNSFYNMLRRIDRSDKYAMIQDLLSPYEDNMFVTPKEVDAVINRLASIISSSLNKTLYPEIDDEDMQRLIG